LKLSWGGQFGTEYSGYFYRNIHFTLSRVNERIWRYFPLYLAIALSTELTSIYLRHHGHPRTNWVYNIYGVFEIASISLMLHQILKPRITDWRFFYFGVILVAGLYVFETISHGIFERYDLTNGLFGLFVVLSALTYLKRLMEDPHYVALSRDPNFWWTLGALFFYFAFTSLNVLHGRLIKFPREYNPLFRYTYAGINVILYALWSYAFICKKWKSRT